MAESRAYRRWTYLLFLVPAMLFTGAVNTSAVSRLLPDLRMKRPSALSIDTKTRSGHKLLRFDGTIVNVGDGSFQVYGHRPNTSHPDMAVTQVVHLTDGAKLELATSASMHYETTDGHNHWHVESFERGAITPIASTKRVGSLAKQGFCLEDDYVYNLKLTGAPAHPVYTNCGRFQPKLLSLTEGISVGYGDRYPANTALQWVDITGLPAGKYQLTLTADPKGQFTELNEANNVSWVQISYDGRTGVKIIKSGPGA